jgi:hypothetical protein
MGEPEKGGLDPLKCLEDIEAFCKGRMGLIEAANNSQYRLERLKAKNSIAYLAYRDVRYLTHQYLRNLKENKKEIE